MSKRNKREKHTNLYLIMRDEKTSKSHNDIQNIKKIYFQLKIVSERLTLWRITSP